MVDYSPCSADFGLEGYPKRADFTWIEDGYPAISIAA